MAVLDIDMQRKKGAVRGRESRNQTLNTKLTEREFAAVEAAATADGKTPGEWLRDVALGAARGNTESIFLAEIVGIRLLVVNVLQRYFAGQKLPPEAFEKMLSEISQAKYQLAEKLIAAERK